MASMGNGISLSLEDDFDNVITKAPMMGSAAVKDDEELIDDSMLSAEEKETVEHFVEEIDIENVDQMVKYGAPAQRHITDFSINILNQVKTLELGDVGETLKELTVALDATTEKKPVTVIGKIFGKGKKAVNAIRVNYSSAEKNVTRVEQDLQKHQVVLTQDIYMYQQMYDLNMEYYKELTMYIIAGRKALIRARKGKLRDLETKAKLTNKQENISAYRDFEDLCNRFEKKLSDLEITRVVSIQSAPQVRMLQNNDRELVDKIQSALSTTIPLWRNQLVLSLGIEHARSAVEAQRTLSDKTNELIVKNSETLKMATLETTKEVERPIVDMDSLAKCNHDLIESIQNVVRIHEEGRQQRVSMHEELVKMEAELKQAMLEAGSR